MPASRKIQNIETPEGNSARCKEIEVRWRADTPQYPHRVDEVVKLPDDSEHRELIRMGWAEIVK